MNKLTVVWFVAALILGAVEIMTLDLIFLMLAAGAIAGGFVAWIEFGLPWQVLAATAVSVGMLLAVRPIALRHLHRSTPDERTNADALVGKQALVLATVDGHNGRVKLAGEVWSARCYDPHLTIAEGKTVDVLAIDGATAVVHATDL